MGELNLLTGRRSLAAARARETGEVIEVSHPQQPSLYLHRARRVDMQTLLDRFDVDVDDIPVVVCRLRACAIGEGSIAIALVHKALHQ